MQEQPSTGENDGKCQSNGKTELYTDDLTKDKRFTDTESGSTTTGAPSPNPTTVQPITVEDEQEEEKNDDSAATGRKLPTPGNVLSGVTSFARLKKRFGIWSVCNCRC